MKDKVGLKFFAKKAKDREEYFEINQNLAEDMWNTTSTPTVADIADFYNSGYEHPNEKMKEVFDFYDNEEQVKKQIEGSRNYYTEEESAEFVRKVMSANNDDIKKAGYFYKLLMAAADDFKTTKDICKSKGSEYDVSIFSESFYNYRVKGFWVEEYNDFCVLDFDDFSKWVFDNEVKLIHVRTPLTCECHKKGRVHKVCEKCAGVLPRNSKGEVIKNVGNFITLMITESATQSALSSMNKGVKRNINDIVKSGYTGKTYDWNDVYFWICDLIDELENENVSSRFYEIALLSRVRPRVVEEAREKIANGDYSFDIVVTSLKNSINMSGNTFGAYIFSPQIKYLKKLLNSGEFEDNSLKLKIALNRYEED